MKRILLVLALSWFGNLAHAQREPYDVAFSPDAKRLAYAYRVKFSADVKTPGEIWVCEADGTNSRRLTQDANDVTPSWSPDSQKIAFVRRTPSPDGIGQNSDLFLVGADGGNLRALTSTPTAAELKPVFSPDGNSLLFIRRENHFLDEGAVVQLDLASGRETVLLDGEFRALEARFSPGNPNAILALCRPIDANGKPKAPDFSKERSSLHGEKWIVEVPLNGGPKRVVWAKPAAFEHDVEGILVSHDAVWAKASKNLLLMELFRLQNGALVPADLPKQANSPDAVASDGSLLVGADLSGPNLSRVVWIYNLQTRAYSLVAPGIGTFKRETLARPSPAERLYNDAKMAFVRGNEDEALALLNQALNADPKHWDSLFLRGSMRANRLRPEEVDLAIADLQKSLEIRPNYADAHYYLGIAFSNRFRESERLEAFNTAIRLDPTHAGAYHWRAGYYVHSDSQPQKALADYALAIRYDPKRLDNYEKRARVYEELEMWPEAIADYSKAIELWGDQKWGAWALRQRATLYEKLGQNDKAAADRGKAEKLEPRN